MKNSEYWANRFTQLEDAQNRIGADALKEIESQYRQAEKQTEGQIAVWYQRFAKNNGITLAKARRWLTDKDLKEFKWDVKEYIKYGQENAISGAWMKELENASAKYHISKLEALKVHVRNSLEEMFSKQEQTLAKTLGNVYKSGYYHTAYEIQKGFNIGFDISGVDQAQVEKVLVNPWASDGYNFSERIWNNKNRLIREVHTELSQNILLGGDPQKAIDSLAKKMNTSKHNAGRLVMTEEAYFSSAGQKEAFKELGVEQFEIVATLDSHTSDICRTMDGKVFPMSEYRPGETAPPFHVYCRSTTAPHFDDDFGQIGERAARNENGKTYYVPADIKYKDWEKAFVNGGDKDGLIKYVTGEDGKISKVVDKGGESARIGTRNMIGRNMAGGMRRSPFHVLDDDEIRNVLQDAEALNIPTDIFEFNVGDRTGFVDATKKIYIRGDIAPDLNSSYLRDRLSQRAVLAHEYYGHYKSHPSAFRIGDWRDEFRASYRASLDAPSLTAEERRSLMLDAYDRAKEAGVTVKYNKDARRLIYGENE